MHAAKFLLAVVLTTPVAALAEEKRAEEPSLNPGKAYVVLVGIGQYQDPQNAP